MLHRHFLAPSFCFTQLVQWLQCQRPQGIESARLGGCGSWDYRGHDTQRCYSSHSWQSLHHHLYLKHFADNPLLWRMLLLQVLLGQQLASISLIDASRDPWERMSDRLHVTFTRHGRGISNVWMSSVALVKVIHRRVSAKRSAHFRHQNAKRHCEANVETMSERLLGLGHIPDLFARVLTWHDWHFNVVNPGSVHSIQLTCKRYTSRL